MPTILDQTADALGADLYKIAGLYDPPAWVKSAERSQLVGDDAMPRHGFADQFGRQFPVHTAAATWLSSAYYLTKRAEFQPGDQARIERRLAESARWWGIAGDVEKLAGAVAAGVRDDLGALPDSDFAVVERFDDGRVQRHLPLRNPAEVKAAAAYYGTWRSEFGYDDRRTIATKILAKAAALAVDLGEPGEVLDRAAGFGSCATKQAAELIRTRAALLGGRDQKLAADLGEIARILEAPEAGVRQATMLHKVASLVDKVDRTTGLTRLYGDGLDRPEDVLFRVTAKVASLVAHDSVRTTTGSTYKVADLSGISLVDLRDHLGDDFADLVDDGGLWAAPAKLAAVLPTAPRCDAQAFDRLAAAAGVTPIVKQGAAAGLDRRAVTLASAASVD